MLNIGVVGFGYWGPNVARNFHATAGAKLVAVSDVSEKRLGLAQTNYPFIRGTKDPYELINAKDVDAVAIVTPVFQPMPSAAAGPPTPACAVMSTNLKGATCRNSWLGRTLLPTYRSTSPSPSMSPAARPEPMAPSLNSMNLSPHMAGSL